MIDAIDTIKQMNIKNNDLIVLKADSWDINDIERIKKDLDVMSQEYKKRGINIKFIFLSEEIQIEHYRKTTNIQEYLKE